MAFVPHGMGGRDMHTKAAITIHWPDSQWEAEAERQYLEGCLQGILEFLHDHPIDSPTDYRTICNRFGRVYAEIKMVPA